MENKEEIVGYVANVYQGWSSSTISLFFTTNRVIVAKILGSGTNVGSYFAGGVIGGALAAKHSQNKTAEFKALSPEIILSKDKKNYAVPYSEIIQIKMKKPGTFSGGHVEIKATNGEQKFKLTNKGAFEVNKYDFSFVPNLPSTVRDKIVMEN